MPKRQNVKTYKSEEVQGDDSYVKVKMPSVEEFNAIMERSRRAVGLAQSRDEVAIAQLEQEANETMANLVLEWNWVDDDGNPLPQPFGNPAVFTRLTISEISFLGECMNPESGKKNGRMS